MALYLTLLEGESPASARPILATEDPQIIRAVTRALRDRLTHPRPSNRAALTIADRSDDATKDEP
jgi:hypothetical protein